MNPESTFYLIRHCPTISNKFDLPWPLYYLASKINRPRLAVVLAQGLELNRRIEIKPETGELTNGRRLLLYTSPTERCLQTVDQLSSVMLSVSRNSSAEFKEHQKLRYLGFGERARSLQSRMQYFLQDVRAESNNDPVDVIVCGHREGLSVIVSELQGGAPVNSRIMNKYAAPGELTIVKGNGKVEEIIKANPNNYKELRQ